MVLPKYNSHPNQAHSVFPLRRTWAVLVFGFALLVPHLVAGLTSLPSAGVGTIPITSAVNLPQSATGLTGREVRVEDGVSGTAKHVLKAADGTLWVAREGQGISARYAGKERRYGVVDGLPSPVVYRLVEGNTEQDWGPIGTWTRLHPPAGWVFCPIVFSFWNSRATFAGAQQQMRPMRPRPVLPVGSAFHCPRAQGPSPWSPSTENGTLQPSRDCWFGTE